jgi:hypothetical protein
MNKGICFLLLLLGLTASVLNAQTKIAKVDRVLFILDGSAIMGKDWQPGQSKFIAASAIINSIIDSVNQNTGIVEFGLRVYGHQFDKSLGKCEDTRMEVGYSKDNLGQTALRLNDLKPKGAGSSAYAITKALKSDVIDTAHYRYSIVLIQGDDEACSEDNCSALINSGKKNNLYRLYKVEFDNGANVADRYCMDNTFEMKDIAALNACVAHIVSQFRVRKPVIQNAVQQTPKKQAVIEEKVLPIAKVNKVAVTDVKIDTMPISKPAKPETVVIKKGSKITSEDPEKFGQINLLNISAVKQMKIYNTDNGVEKEVQDIYPVGLSTKLVKLPIGKYALIYTYGYDEVYKKIFEVLPETVLDVLFR